MGQRTVVVEQTKLWNKATRKPNIALSGFARAIHMGVCSFPAPRMRGKDRRTASMACLSLPTPRLSRARCRLPSTTWQTRLRTHRTTPPDHGAAVPRGEHYPGSTQALSSLLAGVIILGLIRVPARMIYLFRSVPSGDMDDGV